MGKAVVLLRYSPQAAGVDEGEEGVGVDQERATGDIECSPRLRGQRQERGRDVALDCWAQDGPFSGPSAHSGRGDIEQEEIQDDGNQHLGIDKLMGCAGHRDGRWRWRWGYSSRLEPYGEVVGRGGW